MPFFSAEARLKRLDDLWLPLLLIGSMIAYGFYQSSQSAINYGGARFVASLFGSELITAAFLSVITLLLFPVRQIGLRLPQAVNWSQLSPMLVLLLVVFASWVAMRLSLPAQSSMDNALSRQVFFTTLVVGLNEEWIFRGLLMAAFCRRFGLRNGVLLALLCFGLAHAGNALNSENPGLQLLQVFSTALTGSLLALAALATRSLLPAMLAHGLYDFMVVDMGELSNAGANPVFMAPMLLVGVGLGIYGLYRVFHLQGAEPFPA
ncbi:MAG: CPBP family intramembrane glutamic endopeptidase [Pedobacter sp.]|nr:CPBP family intramembrane glutamic endopeptidase [Pedobacter sp.]